MEGGVARGVERAVAGAVPGAVEEAVAGAVAPQLVVVASFFPRLTWASREPGVLPPFGVNGKAQYEFPQLDFAKPRIDRGRAAASPTPKCKSA